MQSTSKYNNLKLQTDQKIEELEKKLSDYMTDKKMFDNEENSQINRYKKKICELEYIYQAAQDNIEAHKKLVAEMGKF